MIALNLKIIFSKNGISSQEMTFLYLKVSFDVFAVSSLNIYVYKHLKGKFKNVNLYILTPENVSLS